MVPPQPPVGCEPTAQQYGWWGGAPTALIVAGQKYSPVSEGRGEPKDPNIALLTADCRVVGALGVITSVMKF